MSGHDRTMVIQPSRFQWNKWKDYLHFYSLVGAIPCLTVIFLTNVFIGPATLEPIPEGYQPKHWEYHRVSIFFFPSLIFIIRLTSLMAHLCVCVCVCVTASNQSFHGKMDISITTRKIRKSIACLLCL